MDRAVKFVADVPASWSAGAPGTFRPALQGTVHLLTSRILGDHRVWEGVGGQGGLRVPPVPTEQGCPQTELRGHGVSSVGWAKGRRAPPRGLLIPSSICPHLEHFGCHFLVDARDAAKCPMRHRMAPPPSESGPPECLRCQGWESLTQKTRNGKDPRNQDERGRPRDHRFAATHVARVTDTQVI